MISYLAFIHSIGKPLRRKRVMEMSNHGHDQGIKMIDRDHQEIAELLLEINFNAARDEDADRKIRRLRILSRVSRSHFLLEEAMMAAAKYPGLALHRLRHAWMMEQIRQLATYWGKEKHALTREPMALMWESHIAHLESEDRAFSLWLGGTGGESERDRALHSMKR
jgi:hemerythrin-like metal-binding protein